MALESSCLPIEVHSISQSKEEMWVRAHPENHAYLSRALKENRVKILTDHAGYGVVGTIRENLRGTGVPEHGLIRFLDDFRLAIHLFLAGKQNREVVYVTFGDSLASYILMGLQFISAPMRRPVPHVLFGCEWEKGATPGRKLVVLLRRLLVNRTVYCCVVNGEHDLRTFHHDLGISRDKLTFLHYHHTLDEFDGPVYEGDYIFSGGFSGRDYAPLIRACSELNLPLKISTNDPVAHILASGNPRFEVRKTTALEALEWMAGSRLVVLPYGKTLLRTGGHHTVINAMLMRKAVIVVNSDTAQGYIEDGKNGIVVESGDYDRLRREIEALYHFDAVRTTLGTHASNWVVEKNLCGKEWAFRVYDLALKGYYETKR